MNKYELALVLIPSLDDESKTAQTEKVQKLIARFEGTIDKVDDWGKKRLAYEIKKVNEGFFSFTTFVADAKSISEIESRLRIDENILRYLIVRKEA